MDPDGFATVGDRGRLSAGVLTVDGRGAEAVVTGGATVLVDDVEQALSRVCGAEVVVVGVAHPRLGQVVAAVCTDPAALAAARTAAREQLAPAQRPRLWFHLPRWPVTAAGKLDRAAIAEFAASGRMTPVHRAAQVPGGSDG
jgi:acyl-CoA synthetase (AMP-forming)/AMP-acid ligase II